MAWQQLSHAAWVVSRAYSHVHDHNLLPLLWLSPALDRPRSVTRVLVLDCGNQWRITIILVGFKVATQSEDKFKKMKDVYGKLREEHIQLLRTDSEKKKQLTQLNEKLEQVSLLHYSHTFHSLHVMSSISSSSSSFPPHPFPFLLILFSTTPSMHAFLHTLLYLSPPPSSFPLLHLFASYRSPVHPPILYLSSNPLFIHSSSFTDGESPARVGGANAADSSWSHDHGEEAVDGRLQSSRSSRKEPQGCRQEKRFYGKETERGSRKIVVLVMVMWYGILIKSINTKNKFHLRSTP